MIVTEKLKDSLKKFMSSRAAAGEGSLKTWGGMQRPPITGSMAEDVADALVDHGVLEKEERASGWVWRKVLEAAPAAAENDGDEAEAEDSDEAEDEAEDEETDDQADDQADEDEEEAPPSAPVAQPAPARRNASVTPAPAPAPAAPVEAPPLPAAPASELVAFVLGLPDAQWSALAATRAAVSRARALRAQGDALEAEALKALDRALSGSPEAPAPAVAAAAAVQVLNVIEGRPPPAGWARTRTVETGENAGTARDKILRLFMASPEKRMRVNEVAEALGWSARVVSGPLCTLVRDEKLERPEVGVYCLAKSFARKVALCVP